MSAASVSLAGIVKRHGAVTALAGIDLDVAAGRVLLAARPSGSGKTTTLRILAGLEQADAGTVRMNGADVTRLEPGERDVAMVFQSYALYPHMTVRENIAFPLRMMGQPSEISRCARRRRASASNTCSSASPASCRAASSSASRSRAPSCASRRCSCSTSRSPTSTPSCASRRAWSSSACSARSNVTAVYVTHDQEEALSLSDRLAVFMDGRIVQVGTPEEVFRRPATVDVAGFLGNPPMNLLPARLRGRACH